jgi:hypothetical protein
MIQPTMPLAGAGGGAPLGAPNGVPCASARWIVASAMRMAAIATATIES